MFTCERHIIHAVKSCRSLAAVSTHSGSRKCKDMLYCILYFINLLSWVWPSYCKCITFITTRTQFCSESLLNIFQCSTSVINHNAGSLSYCSICECWLIWKMTLCYKSRATLVVTQLMHVKLYYLGEKKDGLGITERF